MAKPKDISHSGIVEEITPENIVVQIAVKSQCAACHTKGFCSISDATDKKIEIANDGQNLQIGDEVNVVLQSGLGLSAVWWAYIFPLILLLIVLLVLSNQNFSDLYSGLFAIAIIAIYYGILRFFKDKFKRKYVFKIERP